MRQPTIALIAPADSPAASASWWEPIFRAWPGAHATPRIEILTPEMAFGGRRACNESSPSSWDVAVVVHGTAPLDALMCRLIDVLQQELTPVVFLTTGRGPSLDRLPPGSVLIHPVGTEPALTAMMLATLTRRQPAVRGLDQSLRLSQSFQDETSGEIDRLHQELLLAAKVQRDFLPKHMPVVDGLECGVLFRPAGFVSGDTYDITRLDEYHVGFFLADAMGHGVPAALMTLYISGSLPRRELGPDGFRIVPPAEALRRLNADLHGCMAGPTRFATAICGVIDTRTGVIHLACAGHPPPLRVGPRGVRPVEVSGMLLGVLDDYEFEQVSIRLEEDELLVIHSDGIEAAFNDTSARVIPAYFPHLAQMRRGESLTSLSNAIERLAVDLDAQSGSLHQQDDLTIMALQTTRLREPLKASDQAVQTLGTLG